MPIRDEFIDEHILSLANNPWFVDFSNYMVDDSILDEYNSQQ